MIPQLAPIMRIVFYVLGRIRRAEKIWGDLGSPSGSVKSSSQWREVRRPSELVAAGFNADALEGRDASYALTDLNAKL